MHRATQILTVVCLIALGLVPSFAATIQVPADQPTIQAAINAAANGDTVLVSPGTYKENINFDGKGITVISQGGPAVTIIDGQQAGPVVSFVTGETHKSVISGFTIQNGNGYVNGFGGGGINITTTSPTISNNVIQQNQACGDGSAIFSNSGAPLIKNNVITENGPALYCYGGLGVVYLEDNTGGQIVGNTIMGNAAGGINIFFPSGTVSVTSNSITENNGTGLYVYASTGAVNLTQNLITNNQQVGVYLGPPATLVNNTIANNGTSAYQGYLATELQASSTSNQLLLQNNLLVATKYLPAFYCDSYDSSNAPVLNNNDVFATLSAAYSVCPDQTGVGGNISADPLFVDLLSDNFHLETGSPAIDVGDNAATGLPKKDFDGDARIVNKVIDLGADEFSTQTTLTFSSYGLYFGAQALGSVSAPQTVTLTNHGTASVALTLISAGPEFPQTNTCGSSLAAGNSCDISVSFGPLAGGTRPGALSVMTSATMNPLTADLTGTGLAPQASLSSTYMYFYNQIIGTTGTQTSTLTNTGQAPLAISGIAVSGAADFVQTNNCPIAPNTLAVNANCTITVNWTPLTVGSESANITVTDNANPTTQSIYAYGNSVSAGVPSVSPTSLTFPDTTIGSSSQPQTVILTNIGSGTLSNITIPSSGDFQTASSCPVSLAPGASCTFTVTFTPTYQGQEYGYIEASGDGAYGSQVSATGVGDAAVPTALSLSPSSIAAGSTDTSVTINGTGFVYASQVLLNGTPIYGYEYGGTQITATVPAASLVSPGTLNLQVFTPAPGGGTSASLPLTVFLPVNYASKSTPYKYTAITGTNLNLSYYGSAAITSPFPIQFGGGSYSTLNVGAGGTISFSAPFGSGYNSPIPTTDIATLVAPFWTNLYLAAFGGDNNNVFWQVNGTAPNRQLIVEWRNVPYCCTYPSPNTVKFEVVFFEGSSNILFNYADTVFGGQYSANDNGATATVGVQISSTLGLQYSYDTPSLMSRTSVLYYPSAPSVTLSASTLDFGYHTVGTSTLPQKVTLTNGGLVALNISSIATDNPDFIESSTCGTSVPPGGTCVILVKFTPSQPTAESATLTITDNGVGGTQTVTLNGIGAVSPVTVYPLVANFGGVSVGKTSTLPITLANASNQALTVQQIVTSPAVYSQTNNCGSSVAPGASCTVTVTFAPTQAGTVTGTLSFGLNGKPLTATVKMSGTGM